MRILLVVPRFISSPGQYYEFPLGLCYISACLKQAGFEVETLNLNQTNGTPETIVHRAIREKDIDVFCTGGLSPHFVILRDMFDAAKTARPDIVTVGGGGSISSEPELMCNAMHMDIGVIGEGEITSVELMYALGARAPLDSVNGIVFRSREGRIIRTPARAPIEDLDALPWPDYESFGVEEYLDNQKPNDTYYLYPFDYPRALPVISSRSCPYQCTFCYHPLGNKYRTRSLDSLFAEIDDRAKRYNLNMITILDELFSVDEKRINEFCHRMTSNNLLWIAQMRVDRADRSVLRKLKSSGLFYISYGLESASDTVLKSMRKHISTSQIERALYMTREEKIGIQGNFLFGDPAETEELACETLNWWRSHPEYGINMNFVIPYPGSKLYEHCLEKRLITDKLSFLEQGCPFLNMTDMPQPVLQRVHRQIMTAKGLHRMHGMNFQVELMASGAQEPEHLYIFSATCFHCGHRNTFARFTVSGLAYEKMGCKNCNQRFDYPTTLFPHVKARYTSWRARIKKYAELNRSITVAPSLYDATFSEIFHLLGLDAKAILIRQVLDDRPERHGTLQFDSIPVFNRTQEVMATIPDDEPICIIPCHGYENYVLSLRDEHSIPESRLVYIPFDT